MTREMKEFLDQIRGLLSALDGTEATEVSWEKGEWGVGVRRQAVSAPSARKARETSGENNAPREGIVQVFSPVVGIFHFPEKKPQIGGIIRDGKELGYVEAINMKHFIEIQAPGGLVDIHVIEGQPVGFGEILFTLGTRGEA